MMPQGKILKCFVSRQDSSNLVFRTGETLCGLVIFQVEGEVDVKEMTVKLLGQGATIMQKKRLDVDNILEMKVAIVKDPIKLESGSHAYNFSFETPLDLVPSSLEAEATYIRYWFHVKVKHSTFSTSKYEYPFTVLSDLYVGTAEHQTPKTLDAKTTIPKHLFFGNSGQLHLNVSLDRTGFCPGEKIRIRLTARNDSSKDLGEIQAHLVQRVLAKRGPRPKTKTSVCYLGGGSPLLKMSEQVWSDTYLNIDAIPPSSIPGLIKRPVVEYFLKVFVPVPWRRRNLQVSFPITIGTIPAGFRVTYEVNPWNSGSTTVTKAVITPPLEVRQCTAGYAILKHWKLQGFLDELCIPMTSFNLSSPLLDPPLCEMPSGAAGDDTTRPPLPYN